MTGYKTLVWGYGLLAWSISGLTYASCSSTNPEVNTNNGTYAQNGLITCVGDTPTTTIRGATNGYGNYTIFSGHYISQQTSQVLRWTNPIASPSGNMGINVEPGATVTGSGLTKGLLLVHVGFYTPQGSGINPVAPQITPDDHFAIAINNQGSVRYSNPSNTQNANTNLAAAVSIEGNDSPVDQHITNTGQIYSESGWGVIMSGIAIRGLSNFVPMDEYNFSYGNVVTLHNSGEIIQTIGDINPSSEYYGHSAAVGLMLPSAREVLVTNTETGLIQGKRIGIDVLTNEVVLASTIDNAGRIEGGEEGVALSPGNISNIIGYRPTLSRLLNRATGVISGALRGVSNDGTIDTIDNYGKIIGTASIDSAVGIINQAINNYGELEGDVLLGGATLNLIASDQAITANPVVKGLITGSAGSTVNIGSTIATAFRTQGNASVDSLTINPGSTLELADGAQWSAMASGISNSGVIRLNPQASSAQLTGELRNSGRIEIDCSNCPAQVLNVAGDYQGSSGSLALAVVLAGDNSDSEKLIIDGHASGVTTVSVSNKGGKGAVTQRGIRVITTDSSDVGAFVQAGRVVAGVYDYSLRKGDAKGDDANNWYLTSQTNEPTSPKPPKPPKPTEPGVYRPEVGSYLANLEMANSMFNMQLNDRLGEVRYLNEDEQGAGTVWLRAVTGHGRFYENIEQIKTTGQRSLMQLGADIWQGSLHNSDSWRIGVMGAYGTADNKTRSMYSGHGSKGKLHGYSVGLYGTWFADQEEKNGAYVDTWAQYQWLNSEVDGDELEREKYKQKGLVSSIEAGYGITLADTERADYRLQPSAQVIWSDVHFNDLVESNGTKIQASNRSNVQSRLGIRAYLDTKWWDPKDKALQTFIEVNWIHNSRGYSLHVEDTHLKQAGYKDLKELKAGFEGKFSRNTSAWLSLGQKWGKEDYRDAQGTLGITHQF